MEAKRIRFRSTNWSEHEKKVLTMLVRERADIIEKKDTSSKTNVSKRIAWNEVLSRFNAVNSKKRDMTQLLNQWRNMKNISRKSAYASRRVRSVAGGGPFIAILPREHPPPTNTVSEIIPVEFTVDPLNCYKSETVHIKKETMETEESPAHESSERETEMPPAPAQGAPRASHAVYKKNKIKKCSCCRDSHDHQLFILAKRAREEATFREKEAHEYKMSNERELHERRMAILSLEQEYWQSKISELNKS